MNAYVYYEIETYVAFSSKLMYGFFLIVSFGNCSRSNGPSFVLSVHIDELTSLVRIFLNIM